MLEKRLDSQSVMIDGLGVGDIGNVVLRDRQVMAQDGMVVIITTVDKRTYQIIGQPDIISRGFVYMKSSEKLIYGIKKRVTDLANGYDRRKMENWGQLRNVIRDEIGEYLFRKTERRPMVLPVVIQV
jgi:ribonuclease J